MHAKTLRNNFIEYFKKNGHAHVTSSPVVPLDDPTLLFINAGMNQFKDVFLGQSKRDFSTATTVQKCIRVGGKHNDLDNVGHTARHTTFFEMLGNFSFGDYFKEDAIRFAMEVSTTVFELEKERIWISVFETDDEAYEIWKKYMPEERIVRMGEKDNFWAMGDTGPCGPCTELYYDRGTEYGNGSSPLDDEDGDRFIEFWNLVFMQYNRDESGKMTPLPKPCVDTGAGLERILALKNNVDTVFQTDILRALIQKIEEISEIKYEPNDKEKAPAFHVIADHLRSLCFAIADGAQPSNIERGYVLRKILRRAIRYARMLGLDRPFMDQLVPVLTSLMGTDYPELKASEKRTCEILTLEEESFFRTLKRGGNILQNIIEHAKKSKTKQITGEEAFKLKDTYGFPIEEIMLIAKDEGITVNLDAYQLLEEQAKERSKKAHGKVSQQVSESIYQEFAKTHEATIFTGYDTLTDEATIMGIVVDGNFADKIEEGQEGIIILNQTPFYAEKGGQVGDQGYIEHEKARFSVNDCQSPYTDIIVHEGKVLEGTFLLGEPVVAHVNEQRRKKLAIHHSATHLLHFALCEVVGEHVKQAGSLVETDHLRFDFNHHKALSKEEIREIEKIVNNKIAECSDVNVFETSFSEVQQMGEIKQFFGDKYGSKVRVVDIGGFAKELCGGTHLQNIGKIGLFRIKKESSVAAGVRRIEAVCGLPALEIMYEDEDLVDHVCTSLNAQKAKLIERIDSLNSELKELKATLESFSSQQISAMAKQLLEKKKSHGKCTWISETVDVSPKQLVELGNQLMDKLKSGIIFLSLKNGDRVQLLVRVSHDFLNLKIKANELIKQISPIVGGSGGGKPDMAQAGGKDSSKLGEAISAFDELMKKLC